MAPLCSALELTSLAYDTLTARQENGLVLVNLRVKPYCIGVFHFKYRYGLVVLGMAGDLGNIYSLEN